MNKMNEYLDKLYELRLSNPNVEILLLVNTEEGGDYTYTEQKITSLSIDLTGTLNGDRILIGEDEILEYISENIFDEELALVDGNRENVCSDEEIEQKANELLLKYLSDGTCKTKIIVRTDV